MTLQGTKSIIYSVNEHLLSTHSVRNQEKARITKIEDKFSLGGSIRLVKTFSLPSGNSQTAGVESLRFSGSPNGEKRKALTKGRQLKDKKIREGISQTEDRKPLGPEC